MVTIVQLFLPFWKNRPTKPHRIDIISYFSYTLTVNLPETFADVAQLVDLPASRLVPK